MYKILLIILVVQVFTAEENLVRSGLSPTTVVSDGGTTIQNSIYYNDNHPNPLGNGALWIFDNGGHGNQQWAPRYVASFTTLFNADCPQVSATLKYVSSDPSQVWFNGAQLTPNNIWPTPNSFSVNLLCGVNSLKITVTKARPTGGSSSNHAAIAFSVTQEQSTCFICSQNPTSGYYDHETCQCKCLGTTFCSSELQTWFDYPTCACKCPEITCQEGTYMHTPNCKCQCKKKICPSGQPQNPSNCGCGQQN